MSKLREVFSPSYTLLETVETFVQQHVEGEPIESTAPNTGHITADIPNPHDPQQRLGQVIRDFDNNFGTWRRNQIVITDRKDTVMIAAERDRGNEYDVKITRVKPSGKQTTFHPRGPISLLWTSKLRKFPSKNNLPPSAK